MKKQFKLIKADFMDEELNAILVCQNVLNPLQSWEGTVRALNYLVNKVLGPNYKIEKK